MSARLVTTVVIFTAALILHGTARAATFDVHVCKSPDGMVFGTDGWTAMNPTASVFYDKACDDGSFGVSTGPTAGVTPNGFRTGWEFDLPKPMTLAAIDSENRSSVTLWSGWAAEIWGHYPDDPQWLDVRSCQGDNCYEPLRHFDASGLGAIAFGIRCFTASGCTRGSYAQMQILQLVLHVDDPASPTIDASSGPVTAGDKISGVSEVDFHALDAESGVRVAQLVVDGTVLASQSFDTATGSCHEPFTKVDPCPHEAAGQLRFDTSGLPDGTHSAQLLVFDATSEHPAVSGPWSFSTDNSRVANLCSGGLGEGGRATLERRAVPFGHRATIRLVWPTMPWPIADVVVFTGRDHLRIAGHAVRRSAFHYVAGLPTQRTIVVRLGARAAGSSGPYVCSGPRLLRIRAGASLTANPRHLSNGDRVRLRGRLKGTKVGRRTVVLQARARGGKRDWTPVAVSRTGKHGRFKFSYRFERTFQRTDYQFRARVPAQRGFPYISGNSRARTVFVDP